MLGDFITRILVMVFGYAYPAFECYRVMENNRVQVQELRFWCQYWIIVAILSVLERIGDIFVSWVPMYGELKLALFIYLWYPNTKGSDYVYDAILRPYVAKHEIDIDQRLLAWRSRAWDLALFYWKNCTDLGQSAFFQVLQYVASQSSRTGQGDASQREGGAANRSVSEPTKPNVVKSEAHSETTEYVHIQEATVLDSLFAPTTTFGSGERSDANAKSNIGQMFNQARQRFGRFK